MLQLYDLSITLFHMPYLCSANAERSNNAEWLRTTDQFCNAADISYDCSYTTIDPAAAAAYPETYCAELFDSPYTMSPDFNGTSVARSLIEGVPTFSSPYHIDKDPIQSLVVRLPEQYICNVADKPTAAAATILCADHILACRITWEGSSSSSKSIFAVS